MKLNIFLIFALITGIATNAISDGTIVKHEKSYKTTISIRHGKTILCKDDRLLVRFDEEYHSSVRHQDACDLRSQLKQIAMEKNGYLDATVLETWYTRYQCIRTYPGIPPSCYDSITNAERKINIEDQIDVFFQY